MCKTPTSSRCLSKNTDTIAVLEVFPAWGPGIISARCNGFTLLDLLVAVTIMSIVGAIAIPGYTAYAERSRVTQAIAEIYEISLAIDRFNAETFAYPDDLAELANVPTTDPYGQPYAYLRIEGNGAPGIKGKQRKDKNLNPLNSDFDLYSMGPDENSQLPLTARAARDDIIRAGNGGFVGIADEH